MGLFSDFEKMVSQFQQRQQTQQAGMKGIDPKGVGDIFNQLGQGLQGLQPFSQAGINALPGLEQGSTLEGFGGGLSDIFNSSAIQPLIQDRMRAANSAFGSAGLTRSGGAIQAAADIPTELAMQIEQMLNERQTGLAGLGFGADSLSAELRNQASLGRAGILADRFATQTGADQASKQRKQDRLNSIISTGASIAGAFSDERLKTNIKSIGKIKDLTIYEWDWREGVPEVIQEVTGKEGMTTGFIAQDVLDKHPSYVDEQYGFLTINYDGLMDKLGEANA
jgi:hypothetical protein